jgi:hypothetical protein
MKRIIFFLTAFIVASVIINVYGWGFAAHKKINRMAVFTLPPEMIGFYKKHIDFVTDHAVDPDMRRYANPDEAPRHYLDVDRYAPEPFENLPFYWSEAVQKFGEDSLKAHGIVPWHINAMIGRLTEAFKSKNTELILHYSADIGHYIGDAHVPLHCTSNYNGQKTNQVGIHGFWEGRLPELFFDDYDYFAGRSVYIEKPQLEAWKFIKESYAAHDSVLSFERKLSESFSIDRKYSYEQRGANNVKVYSREYSDAYHKMLDGQVERRLRSAIISVGSFWYTAWVNAGSPDLEKLAGYTQSEEFKRQVETERRKFEEGKIINNHGHSDD